MITEKNILGPHSQGIEVGAIRELLRAIAAYSNYVNIRTSGYPLEPYTTGSKKGLGKEYLTWVGHERGGWKRRMELI